MSSVRSVCFMVGCLCAAVGCTSGNSTSTEPSAQTAVLALERARAALPSGVSPDDPMGSPAIRYPKKAAEASALDGSSSQTSLSSSSKRPRPHGKRCTKGERQLTAAQIKTFAAAIEPLREGMKIPGAAVALIECGEIAYQAGFGQRDLETQRPVTTDTVFRVGSTTKAMTSALVASLVDDGVLDFGTRAVTIDPEFSLPTAELTKSVTVGQLMGMGTGLAEPPPYWWEVRTASDLLQILPMLPVVSPPGQYLYNNLVYASAGYLGLMANGMDPPTLKGYASALERRIFRPTGMKTAGISDNPADISSNHAHSYSAALTDGLSFEDPVPRFRIGGIGPAGSAVTNVTDLARFVIMQLNRGVSQRGTRVVSEKNLMRTHESQTPMTSVGLSNASYAMGWVVEDNAGVETLWHNGGIDAFGTLMWTVPEDELGLVVLANGFYSQSFYWALEATLMRQVYGASNADPAELLADCEAQQLALRDFADTLAQQPQIARHLVRPYLGVYEHEIGLEFNRSNQLVLSAPGMQGILSNISELTGVPLTFVIASGGTLLLQPLQLREGPGGLELAFVDPQTMQPVLSVVKLR